MWFGKFSSGIVPFAYINWPKKNQPKIDWKNFRLAYKRRAGNSDRIQFEICFCVMMMMLTVKVCLPLVLLSSIGVSGASARDEIDLRIFRGMNATSGQFPFYAQILTIATKPNASQPEYIVCGGSIISSTFILTAAHCVEDHKRVVVTLGITDANDMDTQQFRHAERTYVHKGYNLTSGTNDIALVQLANDIEFNELVQPIPLSCEIVGPGVWTQLAARGRVRTHATEFPSVLQWTNLLTIPNEICARAFPKIDISLAKVCTVGKQKQTTCTGDSGSVLLRMFNGTAAQIGVVNGGSTRGCDDGQISIFSRISSYIEWIGRITGVQCQKHIP